MNRVATGAPAVIPVRPEIAPPAETQGLKLWIARGLLGAYVVFLVLLALLSNAGATDDGGLGLWRLRTESALEWIREIVRSRILDFFRLVPVGLLSILSFRYRRDLLERLAFVAAPGMLLALFLTWLVQSFEVGQSLGWTGLLSLLFPVAGALVGTWIGWEWRRGPRAQIWVLPKLVIVFGVLALLVAIVSARAIETKPFPFEIEHVTAIEKRALYDKFRGRSPTHVAEGKTEVLRLSQRQVNQLLSWGLALAREERRARVEFLQDRVTLLVSIGLSGERDDRRYVNVALSGRSWIEDGKPYVRFDGLSLGPVQVPDLLVEAVSKVLERAAQVDASVLSLVESVRELRFHDAAMEVEYGHGTLPRGFVRDLFQEDGPMGDILPSVQDEVARLVSSAPHLPTGDARFGAAVETVFAIARHRSEGGDAVMENQAAILALAILIGSPEVESQLGFVMGEATRSEARREFRGLKLHDRSDWAKHFVFSAASEVLSTLSGPDAGSRLRAELEASRSDGELSGGRLLGDMSGVRFAEVATRDQAAAERIQKRLIGGFHANDFFPDAPDLMELGEAELLSRFDCGEGDAYGDLLAELQARVASSPAYR